MSEVDFQKINDTIARNAESVLSRWIPGGKVSGAEYVCGNLSGEPGNSCRIRLKDGKGSDFATGERWSDYVGLYAAIHNLKQVDAAKSLQNEFFMDSTRAQSRPRKPMAVMPISASAPEPPREHPELGAPSMRWLYKDAEGRPLFFVCRFDKHEGGKEFRPQVWEGTSWWRWYGLPESNRPLYGLERLKPDGPVLFCEGEKAADAAFRLVGDAAYSVMTWPCGANSVSKADFTPVRGREVTIWPDHDDAGMKCAKNLSEILRGLGCTVGVVQVPKALPEKWDAADAEQDGWTREQTIDLLHNTTTAEVHSVKVISLLEIDSREYPQDPVISGLLDMKESLVVVATSGLGKSLLTNQIAFELAMERSTFGGIDFNRTGLFGKFAIPKQRRVLFLQSENSAGAVQRRFRKMLFEHKEYRTALKNIYYFNVNEEIRKTGEFTDLAFMDEIRQAIEQNSIDVLIIDPLISYHGCDENDNAEMRRSLDKITELISSTGIAVIMVHHTGKNGDLTGRGATAIKDWSGTVVGLSKAEDKFQKKNGELVIDVCVPKNRNYPEPQPFKIVRSKNLTFSLISEKDYSEQDAKDIAVVIEALKELGGKCDSANELKVAVMNKAKVQTTKAKELIEKARNAGEIVYYVSATDARKTGYAIQDGGGLTGEVVDAEPVTADPESVVDG